MKDRQLRSPESRYPPVHLLLQLLGFVAASHLLNAIARMLPGFSGSRLGNGESGLPPSAFLDLTDPYLLTLFGAALISAVIEEWIFRGAIQGYLRTRIGPLRAILAAAVLFGGVHLDLHQSVVAALLGIHLGFIRQIFGLGGSVTAHLLNNLLWVGVVALRAAGAEIPASESLVAAALRYAAAGAAVGIAYATLWRLWRNQQATDDPSA